MRRPIYMFWMQAFHMRGLALLNGYPIGTGNEADNHIENKRLNDLIIEGTNVLTIDLGRNATRDDYHSVASLRRGFFGTLEDTTMLFQHTWYPVDGPLPADDTLSEVVRHELRLDRAWGRWSWQDARPYRDEDFRDVVALHHAVIDAASRRDVAKMVELFRIKYAEIDRSIDAPSVPEEDAAQWKKVFDQLVELKVARDEELVATSWSDGRLVDVKGKDGATPITMILAEHALAVPYVVSALGQGLRIVR